MKRIDSVGSIGGRWVDKNPLTGAPGTTFKADYLNILQEEICNVIENRDGGELPLDGSETQLLKSILRIIDKKRTPPRLFNSSNTKGFMAFPKLKNLVECSGLIQTDSSALNVNLTINIEDGYGNVPGFVITSTWAWVFTSDVFPLPRQDGVQYSPVIWTVNNEFLSVEVYGQGTALFIKSRNLEGQFPLQETAIGICYFGKVLRSFLTGSNPSPVDKYCILYRQIESDSSLQPDTIICNFSYFSRGPG